MWHNNKNVVVTHCKNGPKMGWAIIAGMSGWKRIRPTAADGVTNVFMILSMAKANNRKVDVYIKDNFIEQATLK